LQRSARKSVALLEEGKGRENKETPAATKKPRAFQHKDKMIRMPHQEEKEDCRLTGQGKSTSFLLKKGKKAPLKKKKRKMSHAKGHIAHPEKRSTKGKRRLLKADKGGRGIVLLSRGRME